MLRRADALPKSITNIRMKTSDLQLMIGEGKGRGEGGCLSARIKHIEGPIEMFLVVISIVPRRVFQASRVETTVMGD